MECNTFRLCPHNSDRHCYIKTHLSEREVKLACTYLHIIRERLPILYITGGFLDNKLLTTLLSKLYEIELVFPTPIKTREINLENCHKSDFSSDEINKFSVDNASLRILTALLNETKEKSLTLRNNDSSLYPQSVIEIHRLESAISGLPVESSWAWFTVSGKDLVGHRYLSGGGAEPVSIAELSPSQDWHSVDVIAVLKKKGTSLAALSRNHGLSSSTLANTLVRKWPKGERIIAEYLGLDPSVIWPSRY